MKKLFLLAILFLGVSSLMFYSCVDDTEKELAESVESAVPEYKGPISSLELAVL